MHFFQRGDVKYGEKRTSFEVPQSRTKVLLKASPAAFALSTRDLLQCLCNFLGKVAIICATNLTSKVKNIITSLKNCGLLCLFCPFGLLFSTWTIVQQCSKCKKKTRQKEGQILHYWDRQAIVSDSLLDLPKDVNFVGTNDLFF